MTETNYNVSFGSRIISSQTLKEGASGIEREIFGQKSTRHRANGFYKALKSIIEDGKNDIVEIREKSVNKVWSDIEIVVNGNVATDKRCYNKNVEKNKCWDIIHVIQEFAQKRNPKLDLCPLFTPRLKSTQAKLEKLMLGIEMQ